MNVMRKILAATTLTLMLTIGLTGCGDTQTPVQQGQEQIQKAKQVQEQLDDQTEKINEMGNQTTTPVP